MKKSINLNTRKTITVSGGKVTAPVWLLNQFALWGASNAYCMDRKGLLSLAEKSRGEADEIFNQLKTMGVYDDLELEEG